MQNIIEERNSFGKIIAGSALLGATAGLLIPTPSCDKIEDKTNENPQIVQTVNYVPEPEVTRPELKHNNILDLNKCVAFIISWEGTIKDKNGNHILYDDDVNVVVKKRWNGKNGEEGIKQFIQSCKGKPTIGYGETSKEIILKGKISDSEAKQLVLKRIVALNNYLNDKYKYFGNLNSNQKIALISFSYNLGKDFIELGTVKLKHYLKTVQINKISYEMLDCDNTKQNGQLIKCKGLTRRRKAEAKLFDSK